MTRPHAKPVEWGDPAVAIRGDEYDSLAGFAGAKDRTLVLLDARLISYAAHHTRDLSAGISQTSVLHGMMHTLARLCATLNTRRWMLVWDGPNSAESRRQIYGAYKIRQDRELTPPEEADRVKLTKAITVCEEALRHAFQAPQLSIPNVEADDAIGTIAMFCDRKLIGPDRPIDRVVCVTSDKDYYQLCRGDRVAVWRPTMKKLVTQDYLRETYRLTPQQWIDYKAYLGESEQGDNIPGVSGIGEKTAPKFLATHGTAAAHVAALMERKLKGEKLSKAEESVLLCRDDLRISRDLARIRTTVPGLAAMHELRPAAEQQVTVSERAIDTVKRHLADAINRAMTVPRPVKNRGVALDFDNAYGFTSIDPIEWSETTGFNIR